VPGVLRESILRVDGPQDGLGQQPPNVANWAIGSPALNPVVRLTIGRLRSIRPGGVKRSLR
jgi:hypothetical protein